MTNQLLFYSKRLHEFSEEVIAIEKELLGLNKESPFPASDLQGKIENSGFKSPDVILGYVTIIPLMVNLFSAAFCLGCSAFFHLYYVKSEMF